MDLHRKQIRKTLAPVAGEVASIVGFSRVWLLHSLYPSVLFVRAAPGWFASWSLSFLDGAFQGNLEAYHRPVLLV
jgi:hypothetical protein